MKFLLIAAAFFSLSAAASDDEGYTQFFGAQNCEANSRLASFPERQDRETCHFFTKLHGLENTLVYSLGIEIGSTLYCANAPEPKLFEETCVAVGSIKK